jgi:hypothetical protein
MKSKGLFAAAFLALAFLLAEAASGQPVPGKKFELGTAVSYYHGSYGWDVLSDSYTNLNIPLRFGWFVWKGLEIEPEVTAIIPIQGDENDVTFYFEAKVVYNFKAIGKLAPFLGGTTGWGNGLPKRSWIAQNGKTRTMADGVVAGVKYRVGPAVALRAEYKMVIYSWRNKTTSYREGGTLHNGNVGVSVLF